MSTTRNSLKSSSFHNVSGSQTKFASVSTMMGKLKLMAEVWDKTGALRGGTMTREFSAQNSVRRSSELSSVSESSLSNL